MVSNDRGPQLAAVLGTFLTLATLFVCLRIYVKTFLSKNWGSNDGLLIVALTFFLAYGSCSASGIHYGTGRHVQDLNIKDVPKALHYWWLCELFYTLTTVFIRLSIAIFLLRICTKSLHKYIVYGTIFMVLLFSTFYFFLVLFQCSPYSYFWQQYEGAQGSCINPAAVPDASIAHSVVSFTADWILGLLPIALVYDLKMNIRTKISVAALLGLGLWAGIAALTRIPFIKTLALTDDFLFATTDVVIWSTIEPGLGLTAIGGATLRPLFRSFYASTRATSQPSSGTRPSMWRNSRLNGLKYFRRSPPPFNSLNDMGESGIGKGGRGVELRNDVMQKGNHTGIKSPFGYSLDRIGDRMEGGGAMGIGRAIGEKGGIGVIRTVVVSRGVDSEDSSPASSSWGKGKGKGGEDLI